jgi:hypothetical protein
MRGLRKAKRVRLHLVDEPQVPLPSVEGLLVSKRAGEYVVALPQLIVAVGANPAVLESKLLVVPRERVAFYEVISS